MPRRSWRHSEAGQLYCVEWPEWHVECAKCEVRELICPCGECDTLKVAEKEAKRRSKEPLDDFYGWKCIDSSWYCPQCVPSHTCFPVT